jgi:hypothetical protein
MHLGLRFFVDNMVVSNVHEENTTCALAQPCFHGFLPLHGVRKAFNGTACH